MSFLKRLQKQKEQEKEVIISTSIGKSEVNQRVIDANTDNETMANPFSKIVDILTVKGKQCSFKGYLNSNLNMAGVVANTPLIKDGKVVRATVITSLLPEMVDRTKVDENYIPTAYKNITIPNFKYGIDDKGDYIKEGVGDNQYHNAIAVVAYDKAERVVKIFENKEIKFNKDGKFDDYVENGIAYKVACAKIRTNQIMYKSYYSMGYENEEYITKQQYSIIAPYRAAFVKAKEGVNEKIAIIYVISKKQEKKHPIFVDSAQCYAQSNGIKVSYAKAVKLFQTSGYIDKGSFNDKYTAKFETNLATNNTIVILKIDDVEKEYTLKDLEKLIGYKPIVIVLEKPKEIVKRNKKARTIGSLVSEELEFGDDEENIGRDENVRETTIEDTDSDFSELDETEDENEVNELLD